MKPKGNLTSWIDEKGYGFISPPTGGDRIFVHINAFTNRARRPVVGDVITYSLSTDERGRPRAANAAIVGTASNSRPRRSSGVFSYVLASAFLIAILGAVLVSALPAAIPIIYLAVSVATFAAYALDKRAARKGHWRTNENTLHVLALAGGWPGALIAQSRLRHKTRKQPFRAIFWATVVLNSAALSWLLTPDGTNAWRATVSLFENFL